MRVLRDASGGIGGAIGLRSRLVLDSGSIVGDSRCRNQRIVWATGLSDRPTVLYRRCLLLLREFLRHVCLSIAVVSPACDGAAGVQGTRKPVGADSGVNPLWRVNLPIVVVSPAFDIAVGVQGTRKVTAGVDRGVGSRWSVSPPMEVVSPAFDIAVGG